MKKRIICLLLALVMTFSLCLTSCFGGGGNGGDGGDDGNDDDGSIGDDIPVENADILALSYDRLENADLSFNFDFGFGNTAKQVTPALATKTEQNDGTHAYYSVGPEDLGDPEISYDYFKNEEDYLDMLSKGARDLADFMIQSIVVMDTVIVNGGIRYILSYDSDTDTLHAITYTVSGEEKESSGGGMGKNDKPVGVVTAFTEKTENITSITEVKIYYDEGGNETVEMWRWSEDACVSIEYVLYTAGKRYTISRASIGEADSNYSTTSAYKEGGLWRAVSAHFSPNNTLLTKEGVYDYANGLLYLTFLIETEDNVYTFSDTIRPFRDGNETYSQVEALPTDEARILPYALWVPGISIDIINQGLILINANYLTGWDEYRITIDSEYELGNFEYNEHYFTSDKDYFLTSGGVKLFSGENGSSPAWSPEYGWGEYAWSAEHQCECFRDAYGVEHFSEDGGVIAARFCGALAQIDRNNQELMSANIYFRGGSGKESYPLQFATMHAFFDFLGLSFAPGISDNFFSDLAALMVNRDEYTNAVFETLFEEEYSFEGYKNSIQKIIAAFNEYKGDFLDYLSEICEKDAVNIGDQPTRPTNLALISFAEGISGNGRLSANGFDFTSVSFLAKKCVILSEGASYTVMVTLSSSDFTVTLDAFNTVTYAHTDMSFTGKSGALPTNLAVGEYVIGAYLARVSDEGEVVRLSELAAFPIASFDSFNYQVDAADGYFCYTYAYADGAAGILVEFFDTQSPTIEVSGLVSEEVDEKLYYTVPATEGDGLDALLSYVTVTDNYDGDIYPTVANITREGDDTPLETGYPLEDGETYRLSVSDAAANKAEVLFKVTFDTEADNGES